MLSHVISLSPTSTALAEDKVIGTEELTERTSSDCIHGTGFEVDKHSAGNIFVSGSLKLWSDNVLAGIVQVLVHTSLK